MTTIYKPKLTTIICATCNEESQKRAAEIKRQQKQGRTEFYCSRTCAGKHAKIDHLLEWSRSEENKANCRRQGRQPDEFTGFREYLGSIKLRIKSGKYDNTDLDLQYLKELWENQEGKCVYTKVPLTHATYKRTNGKIKLYSLIRQN